MRVLLLPLGSHGDVHPFVGLGRALQARGHAVTLITAAPFRSLAEKHGFAFAQVGTEADFESLVRDPDLWTPLRSLRVVFEPGRTGRFLREAYAHIAERYVPGDTVVVGGTLAPAGRLARDKLGVPYATAHLQPMALNSVTDPPVFPGHRMRGWWPHWVRRLVYWGGDRLVLDRLLSGPVNGFRGELGLPPVRRIFTRWLPSPQLVLGLFPDWYGPARDAPPQYRPTGFVLYDQGDGQPLPAAVEDFLTAGSPPVVFTFGSAMRQGGPYFAAAAAACERLNVRGVLLAAGGDQIPTELPDSVRQFDYAPFGRVFPRAAAVVHHGGIGTSAQALRAGVRQLVMPLAFDQPDNAARLERLGVARVLPPKRFTGPAVATVLKELLGSAAVGAACREVAARMAMDAGLDEACRLIEGLSGTDRR